MNADVVHLKIVKAEFKDHEKHCGADHFHGNEKFKSVGRTGDVQPGQNGQSNSSNQGQILKEHENKLSGSACAHYYFLNVSWFRNQYHREKIGHKIYP